MTIKGLFFGSLSNNISQNMGRYLTKLKFPQWARVAAKFTSRDLTNHKKEWQMKIYWAIKVQYKLKSTDEKFLAEAGFRLAKLLMIQGWFQCFNQLSRDNLIFKNCCYPFIHSMINALVETMLAEYHIQQLLNTVLITFTERSRCAPGTFQALSLLPVWD